MVALVSMPFATAHAETKEERRARLERELQLVERQILQQQVLVEDKREERQSLERDVALLDAQISKAQMGIQARSLAIAQLSDQIGEKEVVIDILEERLEKQRQTLAEIVRQTYEFDDFTLIEVLLSNESFSGFFTDMESFQSLKSSLNNSLTVLAGIKDDTEVQRLTLRSKQSTEEELRQLQELEKREIEKREAEKARILAVTKGEEQAYQKLLQEQQKTASQIRQQLFELRDSGAIPFGQAYELAKRAGAVTGVRPALIMGILTQETKLGENLGVPGVAATDAHPQRDLPIFYVIAETVGFDPNTVPVSRAPGYGWGGAMGPSQFIPSTWAIYGGYVNSVTGRASWGSGYTGTWSYNANADIIRGMLGKSSPSNPYENQDAFLATALLMRDNGAAAGSYYAERLAALRYFAGWGNATNPAYAFYGDGVMGHTERIQAEINILNQ
jgi:peptidoglycan hydrolase CwlO-like protein